MGSFRHFGLEIVRYLRIELPRLNTRYPDVYFFTTEMLDNINYKTIDPSKSYIQVETLGYDKKELQTLNNHIAVRLKQNKTNDIKYSHFEYICKGTFDELINMHGNHYNDFYVCDVKPITAVNINPETLNDKSYSCELLLSFIIDIQGVPAEII